MVVGRVFGWPEVCVRTASKCLTPADLSRALDAAALAEEGVELVHVRVVQQERVDGLCAEHLTVPHAREHTLAVEG